MPPAIAPHTHTIERPFGVLGFVVVVVLQKEHTKSKNITKRYAITMTMLSRPSESNRQFKYFIVVGIVAATAAVTTAAAFGLAKANRPNV